MEEPLFTEAAVDCSATSVGGSVEDSNVENMLRKPPNGGCHIHGSNCKGISSSRRCVQVVRLIPSIDGS